MFLRSAFHPPWCSKCRMDVCPENRTQMTQKKLIFADEKDGSFGDQEGERPGGLRIRPGEQYS